MPDISNPSGLNKPIDFNTFDHIAKDTSLGKKSTLHLKIGPGGREVIGLEAKRPVAGKTIRSLDKPPQDLSDISESDRNGILATQAFKQALIQQYGKTIADALDKHLLKSGQAQILDVADLQKNLKVAKAIVRLLKATASAEASIGNRGPVRTRRATESEIDHIQKFELTSQVRQRTKSFNDASGNQWRNNPLFLDPETVIKASEEAAHLPEDPQLAKAAQRPRSKALSSTELEASFQEAFDILNERKQKPSET
jgi:hypothetical protein